MIFGGLLLPGPHAHFRARQSVRVHASAPDLHSYATREAIYSPKITSMQWHTLRDCQYTR